MVAQRALPDKLTNVPFARLLVIFEPANGVSAEKAHSTVLLDFVAE
eukprot:CAMPEP_0168611420 /NCGR_PEP_ID=MMETSP0449_2-20121227/2350_1 /TAXON_ID=1082188 /ORGANISM="Strombidium rassoulzadegani, Strain ras09" /LENGTH=45 /DNA_ID= /DNA_START= /DNA_END= /DNA_ORIENTATION=